jgi:hypothetical protein
MITEQEVFALISLVKSSRTPHKLFEIPYLIVQNPRDASIRLGTRKIFADFPRIATESLFVFVGNYCDEKFKDIVKSKPQTREEIQKIIEEIKREKEDQETELGYISKNLEKIGIKWWINFGEHYKKPVIIINANDYYKKFWGEKIKDFVQKLNDGYDYPSQIYDMASELTPQYQKLQLRVRIPEIFKVLEVTDLSIIYELENLTKMIEKLRELIAIPTYDVYSIIFIKGSVDATFSDMLGIVHQLYNMLNTGHFFSGYLLLRKLLIDLGIILFFKSFAEEYPKITGVTKIQEEEKLGILYDGLKDYVDNFKTKWMKVYYDDSDDMPLLASTVLESVNDVIEETLEIMNFGDLKIQYNSGNLQNAITKGKAVTKKNKKKEINVRGIECRDTVYIETIDILRLHRVLIFDAVKANIQIPGRKDKLREPQKYRAYAEYHKLSDAVHNPILVDFPPYSSTLEYLGYLHHVRIVNKIFQDVLQVYKTYYRKSRKKDW